MDVSGYSKPVRTSDGSDSNRAGWICVITLIYLSIEC